MSFEAIKYHDECYFGTVYNGKPHGFGISFVVHGQSPVKLLTGSVYEGWWDMGIRSGDGNIFMENGDYYVGNWKSGFFDKGKLIKPNGTCFEGTWRFEDLEMKFKGKYIDEEKEGNFDIQMNDLKTFLNYGSCEGQVDIEWKTGEHYRGGWKNGARHGIGQR